MICRSCGANIPPEFVHAIKTNKCAGCGEAIMDDSDKNLLEELSDAMSKMPSADAQSIAGWLLSNYSLKKIGSAEPVERFYSQPKPKQPQKQQVPQEEQGLKIAENKLEQFLKRTGVKKPKKLPEDYQDLVKQIYHEEDQVVEESPPDDSQGVDEANFPQYTEQVLKTMVTKPQKGHRNTPMNMGAATPDENIDEDVTDLHPALQQDRLDRLEKQRSLNYGSVGKINRSS